MNNIFLIILFYINKLVISILYNHLFNNFFVLQMENGNNKEEIKENNDNSPEEKNKIKDSQNNKRCLSLSEKYLYKENSESKETMPINVKEQNNMPGRRPSILIYQEKKRDKE